MNVAVWGDFTAQLRALEQARVVDFVRFVGRRLEEEPVRNGEPFRETWSRFVIEYADLAGSDLEDDDE